MKKRSKGIRICSPGISRAQNIRDLKTRISGLKVLSKAAAAILDSLLVRPSAAVVRELCSRFRVLQAFFSIRYREAKQLALAMLESLGLRRKSL